MPGRDTRPGGTQSKSSRFDVHRIRYGLRYRKLPGNTALFECFTDERLRNTEVEERDRGRLTSSAELYVPLLGFTLEEGVLVSRGGDRMADDLAGVVDGGGVTGRAAERAQVVHCTVAV